MLQSCVISSPSKHPHSPEVASHIGSYPSPLTVQLHSVIQERNVYTQREAQMIKSGIDLLEAKPLQIKATKLYFMHTFIRQTAGVHSFSERLP